MSADLLRRAAALMRERAEAATEGTGASDWFVVAGKPYAPTLVRSSGGVVAQSSRFEADHIASWHPGVALAVADLLDSLAVPAEAIYDTHIRQDFTEAIVMHNLTGYPEALTMARAYLGESA